MKVIGRTVWHLHLTTESSGQEGRVLIVIADTPGDAERAAESADAFDDGESIERITNEGSVDAVASPRRKGARE